MTFEFSMPLYLCVTLPINVFFADPLLSKSLLSLEKNQLLGSVLAFEQRKNKYSLMLK